MYRVLWECVGDANLCKGWGGVREFFGLGIKNKNQGLPCQSSGEDSALPMQGARVRPLVRELRSHMPHRNKNKKQKTDNFSFFEVIGESLSCQGARAKNLYCEAAYNLDKDAQEVLSL